jgi:hypothetical protein
MDNGQPNSVLNEVHLGYKPIDFFYFNSNLTPDKADCDSISAACTSGTAGGSQTGGSDESNLACYQKELCANRDLATQLKGVQQTNQTSAERNTDASLQYDHSVQTTLNITLGMLLMVGAFYAV